MAGHLQRGDVSMVNKDYYRDVGKIASESPLQTPPQRKGCAGAWL